MTDPTQKHIAIGLASVAAVLGAISYLYGRRSSRIASSAEIAKATELKEKGNSAFKAGNYEEAIDFYTQAISFKAPDQHILYSNRSAAHLSQGNYAKSIEDGEKAIELQPNWGKAYYKVAIALMKLYKFDEAFIKALQGSKQEPENGELRNLMNQITLFFGAGERDVEATIDRRVLERNSKEKMEKILKIFSLDMSFEKLRETALNLSNKEDFEPIMNAMFEKDKKVAARMLGQMYLEAGLGYDALSFAEEAYAVDPSDPQSLLLLSKLKVFQPSTSTVGGVGSSLLEALDLIRKALKLDPTDPQISEQHGVIVLKYAMQCKEPVHTPLEIKKILEELKIGLTNPKVRTEAIFQSGIALWSLLVQHPKIQEMAKDPKQEQILFDLIYLDPFFLEALTRSTISNIRIEKYLTLFRASSSVSDIGGSSFLLGEELLYALGVQGFRNNYCWRKMPEDVRTWKLHRRAAVATLKEKTIDELSILLENGSKFLRQLLVCALYEPLFFIDQEVDSKLHQAFSKVDQTKLHRWVQMIVKKTLTNPHIESDIAKKLETEKLTPIPKTPVLQFANDHISRYWGAVGVSIKNITPLQELQWCFPHFKSIGFDSQKKTRILIGGCASGHDILSLHSMYDNIEITGVDSSVANVAYAVRQAEELGFKADLFLADIPQLDKPHFHNQLFDMVTVHRALNHYVDPSKPLEKLANLLRPGGVIRVSLFSDKLIGLIGKARKALSNKFKPPIFDTVLPGLPRRLRSPTADEIRIARSILEETEDEELQLIKEFPEFYALNELTDLIFHPQVSGFTFTDVGKLLKKVGLNLIGFEFPGIPQEACLTYKVEHPDDPNFLNFEYLEKHGINSYAHIFACEKPVK